MATTTSAAGSYTVPGLPNSKGHAVAKALQGRIHALNDLQLTLKHIHWNVVGPRFIGVHTMLDPQIEAVRAMIDVLAERMATMGVAPNGLPGALVRARSWDDYALERADATAHLGALDLVFTGIIEDHRKAIDKAGDDPVTEDILIGQTADLEQFQWFVRAHLEDKDGQLSQAGARTEEQAASMALTSATKGAGVDLARRSVKAAKKTDAKAVKLARKSVKATKKADAKKSGSKKADAKKPGSKKPGSKK